MLRQLFTLPRFMYNRCECELNVCTYLHIYQWNLEKEERKQHV